MADDLKAPRSVFVSRQLYLFWVVDCSSSMRGEKIGTLNNTIQSLIPEIIEEATDNTNIQLLISTLKFATGASWITEKPVKIEEYAWHDLEAGGERDLGNAFDLLAKQLDMKKFDEHTCPPIIVLIINGSPTDDYKKGLKRLLITSLGKKAVRIAIPIGQGIDDNVLLEFTGSRENILQANELNRLSKLIKWASIDNSGDMDNSSVAALRDSSIFYEIIKICPEVWREKKKFKALLMDYLPNNKCLRNLVLISAEEGIPNEIVNLQCLNSMNRHYYVKRLIDATGCKEEHAETIINMWEVALIGKPQRRSEQLSENYFNADIKAICNEIRIYFLVDTCGGMYGIKIGTVQAQLKMALNILKKYQHKSNHQIFIRQMVFATGARWCQKESILVDEYVQEEIPCSGVCDFGEAFKLLAKELDMRSAEERILLILITANSPTDDYKKGIDALNDVKSFSSAEKYAINMDKEWCDEGVLLDFTKDGSHIIHAEKRNDDACRGFEYDFEWGVIFSKIVDS